MRNFMFMRARDNWFEILKHPVKTFRIWLRSVEIARDFRLDPEMLRIGELLIRRGYPPEGDENK